MIKQSYQFIFLMALCAIMWSCGKKDQSSVDIQSNPIVLEATDSCIMGGPICNIWKIQIMGNKAITYNFGDSGFVGVYDYPSFQYRYSYGSRGGGENEWIAPMYGSSDDSDEIILYDMAKQKLYTVIIGDSIAERNFIADLPADGEGLALPIGNITKVANRPYITKINDMKKGRLEVTAMDGSAPSATYMTELTVEGSRITGYPLDDFKYDANQEFVVVAYCEKEYITVLNYNDASLTPLFSIGKSSVIDGTPGALRQNHVIEVVEHKGRFYILRPTDNGLTGCKIDVLIPATRKMYTIIINHEVRHIAFDDNDNLIGIYETEEDNVCITYKGIIN